MRALEPSFGKPVVNPRKKSEIPYRAMFRIAWME
jgi:hypothetical protein